MRIRVLGGCEVGCGGETVSLRFRRAELVGYLALRPYGAHRATVATALWPDALPSDARHNLRQTMLALRAKGLDLFRTEGETIRLVAGDVDVRALLAALETVFEPDDHGELLPGLTSDWILFERERLDRAIVAACRREGEMALAHDPRRALAYADLALARDPWLEASRALRVRALVQSGEKALAEREIQKYEGEVGAAPGLRAWTAGRREGHLALDGLSPHEKVRMLTIAGPTLDAPGKARLAEALAESSGLPDEWRSDGEAALATIAMEEGDASGAERLARAAYARSAGTPAATILAWIFVRADRSEEALALVAAAQPGTVGDAWTALEYIRGAVHHKSHDFPEAERVLRHALAAARATGNARLTARIRLTLAITLLWAGRDEAGMREVREGLASLGDDRPVERATFRMALGRFREAEGHWVEAEALYDQATVAFRETGHAWFLSQSLTHTGDLARRRGAVAESEAAYREAIAIRRRTGDRLGAATALKGLGQLLGAEGEGALRESLAAYLACGEPLGAAMAHLPLARLLRDLGRREEARTHAARAVEGLARMKATGAGLATDDTASLPAARALLEELDRGV